MGLKAKVHNGTLIIPRVCHACKVHLTDAKHSHGVYITGEGYFYLCDRCRDEFEQIIRFKNSNNLSFKVKRWLLVKRTSLKPVTTEP